MQLIESRKFKQYTKRYISRVPFTMKASDGSGGIKAFDMQTRNVSYEGLGVELYERQDIISIIPSLVLQKKPVEMEMKLPPTGEKIRGIGRIVWYDTGSREPPYPYLRLGIFLEQMEAEDRRKWEYFVENLALEAGEES